MFRSRILPSSFVALALVLGTPAAFAAQTPTALATDSVENPEATVTDIDPNGSPSVTPPAGDPAIDPATASTPSDDASDPTLVVPDEATATDPTPVAEVAPVPPVEAEILVRQVLAAGDALALGEHLLSVDGTHRFSLLTDGTLEVSGPTGITWTSPTHPEADRLVLQHDGNLVLYTALGVPLWNSGTHDVGLGATLVIQADSNLVLHDQAGAARWSTRYGAAEGAEAVAAVPTVGSTLFADGTLAPGTELTSSNGAFRAVMQTDGNLVVYGPGNGVVWHPNTRGGQARLVLQGDGNLVLYRDGGGAVWSSNTRGTGNGHRLVMQNDGNLVLNSTGGIAVWSALRRHRQLA